ncbi:MAG: energy-coupling factor transporter ATPase [Absicoccus porci]|uniref:energy-coupling factor transporter ATPase n=1 Tax=Absicoccus porci TaxID=2486576 RepID=UPI002354C9F1|nr:energy-coupling factor transporter ATPase [Absicoccus porci]MCI6088143.1 energy-coupling factor transporter ATPase [Absicoccus porci]MDD7331216.1 energy-coupling factor transporter ATPase [Absicoccus porci]MDY4739421.1 energy-coupling factor transporter ATPase [Absicoccus porci]
MENAIEVSHLSFAYTEEAETIKDVSFTIPKGSYTTIIGHNGSGKSTIAKLIIGLLGAKSGTIKILDQVVSPETIYELRSHVGIVFQNPDNQFIGSTVADDIAFGLENHCVPQEQMQDLIDKSATAVGMTDFLDAEPTHLSGGQKQRVAIAGILAMAPEIIIFDESTSMLDPQGKASINQEINHLHQSRDITILSITHDMEEVAQSEHVIVLNQGKIEMEGTPKEIFAHPDLLKNMQLDIPFALKFSKYLQSKGILHEDILTLDKVVDAICQLKSTD